MSNYSDLLFVLTFGLSLCNSSRAVYANRSLVCVLVVSTSAIYCLYRIVYAHSFRGTNNGSYRSRWHLPHRAKVAPKLVNRDVCNRFLKILFGFGSVLKKTQIRFGMSLVQFKK